MRRGACYSSASYVACRARDKSFVRAAAVKTCNISSRIHAVHGRRLQLLSCNDRGCRARVDYACYSAQITRTRGNRQRNAAAGRTRVRQRTSVLPADDSADRRRRYGIGRKRRSVRKVDFDTADVYAVFAERAARGHRVRCDVVRTRQLCGRAVDNSGIDARNRAEYAARHRKSRHRNGHVCQLSRISARDHTERVSSNS